MSQMTLALNNIRNNTIHFLCFWLQFINDPNYIITWLLINQTKTKHYNVSWLVNIALHRVYSWNLFWFSLHYCNMIQITLCTVQPILVIHFILLSKICGSTYVYSNLYMQHVLQVYNLRINTIELYLNIFITISTMLNNLDLFQNSWNWKCFHYLTVNLILILRLRIFTNLLT